MLHSVKDIYILDIIKRNLKTFLSLKLDFQTK